MLNRFATIALALTVSVATQSGCAPSQAKPLHSTKDGEPRHEVWMLDQSNTYDSNGDRILDSGGTLYIFDDSKLVKTGKSATTAGATVIDLGGDLAEWVRGETGSPPVRPHYLTFNASGTHAIISFVASGHVLIIDAASRSPAFVVDVGAQAHAALPSPDETYILVANQNGKLLQKINTNYVTGAFELDDAPLDLASGVTPSGALRQDDGDTQTDVRPDNAPILVLPDGNSTLAYVTLRGGGLFVVDTTADPMAIVAEYTKATIEPAGLLAVQKGAKLYFNSGGGGGAELGHQSILYRLPTSAFSTTANGSPDTPAPVTLFDHRDRGEVDSHGLLLTRHQQYLWVADRAANSIVVVDTQTDTVVNEISLAGELSDDPAPDLLALSPAGDFVYTTLRGPNPLTGNNPEVNNARGSTPGLGVIRVAEGGSAGTLEALHPISNLDAEGEERADPHGVAVRLR